MDAIIQYFLSDPLKILYILGGAGGVHFWVEKWRGRIHIQVRPLNHSYDTNLNPTLQVDLEFEVVNLGKSPTSLAPSVLCSGYDKDRKLRTAQLQVQNEDRLLPPHATRQFKASGIADATYLHWLFKTYRICPTRGTDRVLYTRIFPNSPLSMLRYDFELTLYRWSGRIPFF